MTVQSREAPLAVEVVSSSRVSAQHPGEHNLDRHLLRK